MNTEYSPRLLLNSDQVMITINRTGLLSRESVDTLLKLGAIKFINSTPNEASAIVVLKNSQAIPNTSTQNNDNTIVNFMNTEALTEWTRLHKHAKLTEWTR